MNSYRLSGHVSKLDISVLRYFKEASVYNLLSPKEEKALINKKDHDKHAFDKLVKHNLRLVISLSKRFYSKGLPLIDLIQDGNIGLIRGVEKFNKRCTNRLSTYVTWWIIHEIMRGIDNKASMVKVPGYILNNYNVECTKKYDVYRKQSFHDIEDFWYLCAEDNKEDLLLIKTIEKILDKLTEKERDIIIGRFSLDRKGIKNLRYFAEKYNLSRERIRQITDIALNKIIKIMKDNNLYDILQIK